METKHIKIDTSSKKLKEKIEQKKRNKENTETTK